MRSSPSPPEDAQHFRGTTLTPESPKPLHYPSPSNIPILEKQMDPMLGEPALNIGTPVSYHQQTQTPNSSTSYYAEASQHQNASAVGTAVGLGPAYALQAHPGQQNTSAMHTFSQPLSSSDANNAPVQENRAAYASLLDPNANAIQTAQSPSLASVDVQALLDQLSTPANGAVPSQYAPPPAAVPPSSSQQTSLPAAPHLPPRPPPQEKPSTHPNYNPNDDIRSFHPHSSHRGSVQLQPVNARGGGAAAPDKMSPTGGSGYQRQTQDYSRSGSIGDDEDSRWPPEVNKKYEDFLEQERRFVTDGQWDQFPMGSRLFIGNLPTEKVTKRDIFHRFHRHGNLAQISIKQAYGFVQFLDAESCSRALRAEQGQQVRGRKMHLEISKPQRNTKKAEPDRNAGRRRSRSPEYTRGGRASNPMSPRDNRRFRDDYRPTRSPSPRRGGAGYRARDPSPDRYRRRRSDSRSPRRYRSPSPRRASSPDLPLPFRAPHEVPDVQVLVLDEGLPRDFIRWVETTFKNASLRIDVLILSPRLNEHAVVRRQIMEGVLAIVRLNNSSVARQKINVQLFDRRAGNDNVKFDEYTDLDPATAVALVADAKRKSIPFSVQQSAPTTFAPYGVSAANPYAPTMPTANPATPANLSNLISTLDPNSLSQLLGAMTGNGTPQVPQAQAPTQPASITPDLARLLSSVTSSSAVPVFNQPTTPQYQQQQQQQQPQQQQPPAGQAHSPYGPQYAVRPPQTQPSQTSANKASPDMAEIMAQLAKYQR